MHQVNVETSAFGIPPADIALDGVYATPLSPALIVLVWDTLALNFRCFIFPSFIFFDFASIFSLVGAIRICFSISCFCRFRQDPPMRAVPCLNTNGRQCSRPFPQLFCQPFAGQLLLG